MKKEIRVSVRSLVEFVLRSGDIDTLSAGMPEMDAMLEGARIHRRLQREGGPSYKAEVPLSHTSILDDGLSVTVSGRADGIISSFGMAASEDGSVCLRENITIDEIKGTRRSPGHITQPVPEHLAQARCYVFFYACSLGQQARQAAFQVQVRYVHLDTGAVKIFKENVDLDELEEWYSGLIRQYAVWIRRQADWENIRNEGIIQAHFPYTYRPGQKKLVAGVYQTIRHGGRLFVKAPTGTGKTIAVLYPALQAMGRGEADRIFYLTARGAAREAAEQTLALLAGQMRIKSLSITAKDKVCILDQPDCSPLSCPRAAGHYDRVNEALMAVLDHEDAITRDVILDYARRYNVCPFEFQLDAALFADVVICDYNYIFDPDVFLKRFFMEKKGNPVFLVDEAHNLVERGRQMYGAGLSLKDLEIWSGQLKGAGRPLTTRLSRLLKLMRQLEGELEDRFALLDSAAPLVSLAVRVYDALQEEMKIPRTGKIRQAMTDLFFAVRSFLMAYERSDERYAVCMIRENGAFSVQVYCMDPSKDLSRRLEYARAAIFFSAALFPATYYKEMISDSAGTDYDLWIESPFDSSRRLLAVASDVSSRYSRRNRTEYSRIVSYIQALIHSRRGNYMIFFPSYKMLSDVFDIFAERELQKAGNGLHVLVQEPGMDEKAREDFLQTFRVESGQAVVGFCVMGGIFSEGIDLTRESLIGAAVVGTGLPLVSPHRELLRAYFDSRGKDGYSYAYVYPGMNKVMQACGRVIRTEKDAGLIVLLDERFLTPAYQRLFPPEWRDAVVVTAEDFGSRADRFWDSLQPE